MKDANSQIHLRPYALYSLIVSVISSAMLLILSLIPYTSTILTFSWLETSIIWVLLSLAGLAGASVHDANDVKKPTEILGLTTFCIAAFSFVLHLFRLGLFEDGSQLFTIVTFFALLFTVVSIGLAIISSVLPTLLRKRSTLLFTTALLTIISTALAVVCSIALLFISSAFVEIIAISSMVLAGMFLLLIPIFRHTMYVHKTIKGKN